MVAALQHVPHSQHGKQWTYWRCCTHQLRANILYLVCLSLFDLPIRLESRLDHTVPASRAVGGEHTTQMLMHISGRLLNR